MSLVLDCSVTLTWYFRDEQTAATLAVLDRVAAGGAVVPELWRLEVANGLQSAVRRRRVTVAYRDESLRDLSRMSVEIDAQTGLHAWFRTLELADLHGLTVYDASYLELALRLAMPLATLDRDLRKAAVAERVELLG